MSHKSLRMNQLSGASIQATCVLVFVVLSSQCACEFEQALSSKSLTVSQGTVETSTDLNYGSTQNHLLAPRTTTLQDISHSRTLKQRTDVSRDGEEVLCGLSTPQRQRFYDRSLHQWLINDEVLQEMNNDIQAIVNCTSESDVLVLSSEGWIRPVASITLPWNLTLRGESSFVTLTCPRRGALFIANTPELVLENLTITSCNGSSSIIVLSPMCTGNNTGGTTVSRNMILEDNSIFEEAHVIDSANASCSQLEITNALFRRNRCMGTHCVSLGSRTRLTNIQLLRNRGSSDSSFDSSFFTSIQDSEIIAVNLTARRNSIRSFQISNGSLYVTQSVFSNNTKSQLATRQGGSIGGGVVFANHSLVLFSNTMFEGNHAAQGGGSVFALASEMNITNCTFLENEGREGQGGAIFADLNNSITISNSVFSRNHALRGSGLFSNNTWSVQISESRFSENNSSVSGGVLINNGTANIRSCEFFQNSATRACGALCANTVEVVLSNLSFVRNVASFGGACLFSESARVRADRLSFDGNLARDSDGGGIMLSYDTRFRLQNSSFQNNRAGVDGGAISTWEQSTTILRGVEFINNFANGDAGAVLQLTGRFLGVDLRLYNNSATNFAGALSFFNAASASVSRSLFEGNRATNGGAIHVQNVSSAAISNSTFFRNSCGNSGGVIYTMMSRIDLSSSLFQENRARRSGGVVSANTRCSVSCSNSTLDGNTAEAGGAIHIYSNSTLILSNSTFLRNRGDFGGAIMAALNVSALISRGVFMYNDANFGGCINLIDPGQGTVSDSLFLNNTARSLGGAISLLNNFRLSISRSLFSDNDGGSFGGALVAQSNASFSLSVVRCRTNTASYGGSLYISGFIDAEISDCSFTDNVAVTGGAISLDNGSTLSINNSILSNNEAIDGGALYLWTNCTASLEYCNFTNNVAADAGGAINLQNSALLLLSTHLAFNNASSGGSLSSVNSSLEVYSSSVVHGRAGIIGGAMHLRASSVAIEVTQIQSNSAMEDCGGMSAIQGSFINASGMVLESNSARNAGGGICVASASSLVCYLCQVHRNRAFSGAGLYTNSDNAIPIVAQFQDSSFENNTAVSYGGGIEFEGPHNRSIKCSVPGVTCGHVILLNTSFIDNFANHSGAAVLTTDPRRVLISCEYNQTRIREFLTEQAFNSLDIIHPKRLCPNWRRNRISNEAYGDIVGTYGQDVSLSIAPDEEVRLTGSIEQGLVLENVNSGRQLPVIQVTVLDGFGVGPAPTNPFTFEASLSSPDDFFLGVYPTNITAGSGSFSRVVGLSTPGNYSIKFTFENEALEPMVVAVLVRRCQVGEEPTNDELTCQECDSVHYNFNPDQPGGCRPCHENANCTGRFIVPREGYWHKSPCHDNVKECLTEKACSYETRQDTLANFTQNLTNCDFNTTELDDYGKALCNEGYEGLLCGSCENSYGLSLRFRCLKCPSNSLSLLILMALTLYLLIASYFTIRGCLPLSLKKLKGGAVQTPSRNSPGSSTSDTSTHIEIKTHKIEEQQQIPQASTSQARTSTSQLGHEFEITKWRTTEIFKIMINFLQTIAVIALISVQWTAGILGLFESSEYVSALTTAATSRPVDCLAGSNSASSRALWRMFVNLLIPGFVVATFATVWGINAFRKKKGLTYFWKRVLLSIITVVYISYLGLTKLAVRGFYCIEIYDSDDPLVDSKRRFWAIDTSIRCYTGQHHGIIALAVVILFVISISFPMLSAYVLITNKEKCKERNSWIFETAGFLFRAFKESCVFWESVVMFRKACLSVIVVFSYPLGGDVQGLLSSLVIFFALYIHLTFRPYGKDFRILNQFESCSLLISGVTITLGLFFINERCSDSTKLFLAVIIISSNSVFFAFLLLALISSHIKHLRVQLQLKNIPLSAQAPWWIVLKTCCFSRLRCCRSKN